ncbi:unnamed protein product [Protopolystoma xenopodis]|uniref:Uncharacterized protein n=1 Tax=Protopolystoma xenopodis TaxID=117903 RepID=A0A448WFW3_9PLAT|nr:unnamed protein product [Protopolystoma xenopodis]
MSAQLSSLEPIISPASNSLSSPSPQQTPLSSTSFGLASAKDNSESTAPLLADSSSSAVSTTPITTTTDSSALFLSPPGNAASHGLVGVPGSPLLRVPSPTAVVTTIATPTVSGTTPMTTVRLSSSLQTSPSSLFVTPIPTSLTTCSSPNSGLSTLASAAAASAAVTTSPAYCEIVSDVDLPSGVDTGPISIHPGDRNHYSSQQQQPFSPNSSPAPLLVSCTPLAGLSASTKLKFKALLFQQPVPNQCQSPSSPVCESTSFDALRSSPITTIATSTLLSTFPPQTLPLSSFPISSHQPKSSLGHTSTCLSSHLSSSSSSSRPSSSSPSLSISPSPVSTSTTPTTPSGVKSICQTPKRMAAMAATLAEVKQQQQRQQKNLTPPDLIGELNSSVSTSELPHFKFTSSIDAADTSLPPIIPSLESSASPPLLVSSEREFDPAVETCSGVQGSVSVPIQAPELEPSCPLTRAGTKRDASCLGVLAVVGDVPIRKASGSTTGPKLEPIATDSDSDASGTPDSLTEHSAPGSGSSSLGGTRKRARLARLARTQNQSTKSISAARPNGRISSRQAASQSYIKSPVSPTKLPLKSWHRNMRQVTLRYENEVEAGVELEKASRTASHEDLIGGLVLSSDLNDEDGATQKMELCGKLTELGKLDEIDKDTLTEEEKYREEEGDDGEKLIKEKRFLRDRTSELRAKAPEPQVKLECETEDVSVSMGTLNPEGHCMAVTVEVVSGPVELNVLRQPGRSSSSAPVLTLNAASIPNKLATELPFSHHSTTNTSSLAPIPLVPTLSGFPVITRESRPIESLPAANSSFGENGRRVLKEEMVSSFPTFYTRV